MHINEKSLRREHENFSNGNNIWITFYIKIHLLELSQFLHNFRRQRLWRLYSFGWVDLWTLFQQVNTSSVGSLKFKMRSEMFLLADPLIFSNCFINILGYFYVVLIVFVILDYVPLHHTFLDSIVQEIRHHRPKNLNCMKLSSNLLQWRILMIVFFLQHMWRSTSSKFRWFERCSTGVSQTSIVFVRL